MAMNKNPGHLVAPISSKLGAPTHSNNVPVVLLAIPCFEDETQIILIYTFAPWKKEQGI